MAADVGATFVDAQEVLVPHLDEPLFLDPFHLTARGHRLIAEALLTHVLAAAREDASAGAEGNGKTWARSEAVHHLAQAREGLTRQPEDGSVAR